MASWLNPAGRLDSKNATASDTPGNIFVPAVPAAAAWLNWFHGVAIDVMQLAQGLGIVAGAHGAALWAKKDTEPQ